MAEALTAPAIEDRAWSTALACLVAVGRSCGLDLSEAVLQAGSGPGPDGTWQEALGSCAERAGFRCRGVSLDERHVAELSRALPAIVRMRDGRSCVLSRLEKRERQPEVTLQDPGAGHDSAPVVMSLAAFAGQWTGDVLLLRRRAMRPASDQGIGWAMLAGLAAGQGRPRRDVVLSTLALAGLALVPILIARMLIAAVVASGAHDTLVFLGLALALTTAFEGAFMAVRQRLVSRLAATLGLGLETVLFERLLRLPLLSFQTVPHAALTQRFARAACVIATLAGPLSRLSLDVAVALVLLPVMLVTSVVMALAALAAMGVAAGMTLLLGRRQRRAARALRAAEAERHVLLAETVGAFETVKGMAIEARQRRRWDVLTARVTRHRLAEGRAAGLLDIVGSMTASLAVFGAFACGAALTVGGIHTAARADLFVFLLLAWRLVAPLRDWPELVSRLGEGQEAMAALVAAGREIVEEAAARGGAGIVTAGALTVTDVDFTYPDAAEPVLRSISFAVPAGAILGITGRSGAGKSTVVRLLQRLHDPFSGLIKIDGIDVRDIGLDHLRSRVALVEGESPLLPGTVGENLRIARPDAPDEDVLAAVRLVGAETMIEALPQGYDTRLGDGATPLSDGQRQRLVLARALIARPAVLLLDEATSALDGESEAHIMAGLKQEAGDRTTVVVAQRLAALTDADAILVLDRGEVQDIGPHAELVGRSDFYSGLWRRQTGRLERPADAPPAESRLGHDSHVA